MLNIFGRFIATQNFCTLHLESLSPRKFTRSSCHHVSFTDGRKLKMWCVVFAAGFMEIS